MSGISLTGLASGLDTSAMIEELMRHERLPYNNLETRKTTLTNEQSTFRSLNTKLVGLRSAVADLMYTTSFGATSAKASDNTVVSVSSTDSAAAGSYDVAITTLAKKQVVSSAGMAATGNDPALSGTFKLHGKGFTTPKEITITGANNKEKLENLRNSINEAKAGVTASLIETKPGELSLVLTSDRYGKDNLGNERIQLTDLSAGPYPTDENVHIDGDAGLMSALNLVTKQPGQNAVVKVNGIDIEASGNELVNVVPGLTINLLKEGASTTIGVATDTDKIAAKVQKFVDAYNEVVDLIRTNTAKGADLQGDSTLRTLQSELSDLINGISSGTGAYKFLFEIGLEIDKGVTSGSLMTGKLSFDKSKFVEAYNKNPDAVIELFTRDGDSKDEQGIATRLYSGIFNWTRTGTGYLAYKISGYDSDIKMITQQMEDMDLRLTAKQKQLESQFAAMETALSSLRNQQSWLSSQISSMGF